MGGEYFKIWIVNIFLSILTLGIYSAWAKVRTKRYFYGNTRLDNSSFEYHAKPIAILKGRLIAVAFLAVVLLLDTLNPYMQFATLIVIALVTPWVIWRSLLFNARMTSYRNVRFGFSGKASPLYLYLLLLPLAPFLIGGILLFVQHGLGMINLTALGTELENGNPLQRQSGTMIAIIFGVAILVTYLLIPYIQKSINSYYFNGHRYGQGKFRARLEASAYYLIYLKAMGIFLLAFAVFGALIALIGINSGLMEGSGPPINPGALGVLNVLVVIVFFGVFSWIKAYTTSRFRNYSVSRLKLQSVATFSSRMRVNKLFWIQFTNIILLLVTIGLAWPWAIVRLTRYRLETIDTRIYGDIDSFVTQMQQKQSALGEEIGEAFDLDLDLGI